MAVMQNSLIFGGVNSADYGIYISGEGVFNAPKRDVEMISIPGRNGTFALDKGRFENIEVTYPAITFEPGDYDTFARNLADFRNAICSQRGYQRLTDTFHPEEYRMATYIGGLDIKPIKYNTASQFNLVFDCKPQRYLMSGEAAVDVSDGDTLLNPTLFESSPLLEVEGYGNIAFNGYEIQLENADIGGVYIEEAGVFDLAGVDTILDDTIYKTTDTLYITGLSRKWALQDYRPIGGTTYTINSVSTGTDSGLATTVMSTSTFGTSTIINGITTFPNISFRLDQDYSGSNSYTFTVNATPSSGTAQDYTTVATVYIYYRVNTKRLQIYAQFTQTCTTWSSFGIPNEFRTTNGIYIYSTVSALGDPTYIDCDLGEAYLIRDGSAVSLNRYIDLGSDLPKLTSGINAITFDNTITELKIVPRWWKV